jgi:RNA polymerase sigma-70 factor (ECF subfamily)
VESQPNIDAAPPPRPSLTLESVYREHAQDVARWAQRLGGPAIDVEDVVHEVFLVVHGQLAGFRGDAKVSTWLYRITENVVRHRRRRDRIRRWLGGTSEDVGGRVPSSRPTPVEELERRESEALVYRALDTLPDKQRALIVLFELEGCSGEQIAEMTGTKVNAVWVALHRARARFLDAIEKLDPHKREDA